jgi:hypothetical protein
MVRAVGGRVNDLVRVSFAGLTAGGLPEGGWRVLGVKEVDRLKRLLKGGRKPRPRAAPAQAPAVEARPSKPRTGPAPGREGKAPLRRPVEQPISRRQASQTLRAAEGRPEVIPGGRKPRGRKG